nr:immunoglobulin heavy chain junction region [Mus musculus]
CARQRLWRNYFDYW